MGLEAIIASRLEAIIASRLEAIIANVVGGHRR